MKKYPLKRLYQENKQLLVLLILMSVFRSAIADWNTVPSGSMQPTIAIGDRIGINKMAYDLRVPFSQTSLYEFAQPQRGEIVIFESEAADKRMVKRVIGLPGDKVEMKNEKLFVNGDAAHYFLVERGERSSLWRESFDPQNDKGHLIKIDHYKASKRGNFSVIVPEGQFLVLGDNRRNSADSRVYGFIPRAEIIGQAENVVLSLDYDELYLPRTERFWMDLI